MPESDIHAVLTKLYTDRVRLSNEMITAAQGGDTGKALDLAMENIIVCNELITSLEKVIQSMWNQTHEAATEARRRSS